MLHDGFHLDHDVALANGVRLVHVQLRLVALLFVLALFVLGHSDLLRKSQVDRRFPYLGRVR